MGTRISVSVARGTKFFDLQENIVKYLYNLTKNGLPPCLFWCNRWRSTPRTYCHGVEKWCCSKDRRKFPFPMHWWKRIWIQGIHLPQSYPQLHVPRRWLYQPQRNWRQIHLWKQIRGWELPIEAHWTRNLVYGQRWTQHQRIPIFHVYRQNFMARRKTRCFRTNRRRHGCREEGWIIWISIGQMFTKNCCCWLWPTLIKIFKKPGEYRKKEEKFERKKRTPQNQFIQLRKNNNQIPQTDFIFCVLLRSCYSKTTLP